MGVSVTGGVCVHATPLNDSSPAALYIVGGNANSTQNNYQGLQRYLFQDRSWESISLPQSITQNRLYHDAIYLNTSSSILMYAGTQDGSRQPTSHTFTISTLPPYQVLAFDSVAPPAISPLLLAWSDDQAAMIGGTDTNSKVMLFSPSSSWEDSLSSLDAPLKNNGTVSAIVVTGDDGSKNLYTFDMTVSPNQVNRTVLVDENGSPVRNSRTNTARRSSESRNLAKRARLTVAEWPAYNGTLVPNTTRTGYSVAQDSSDLVVFSGGNDDDVLCMFNARENSWEDATALLTRAETPTDGTPSVSTTPQTPSQSDAAASAGSSSPFNYTVLGIVIGSVVGLALAILAVLLCIRRRRNQRAFAEAGHQRRASGVPIEKDPMDFADRGISFDTSNRYQRHAPSRSEASFSSMAILMGKVKSSQPQSINGRRNGSNGSNASDSSSTFNNNYKKAISKPIPQVRPVSPQAFMRNERPAVLGASSTAREQKAPGSVANQQGETRRSSGWNRYWSGGSALNVLGFGNKRTTYGSQSDRDSVYSDTGLPTTATQASAMVPPLSLGIPQGRMSQVPSGSPTIAHQARGFQLELEMKGEIGRSNSMSSVSSYGDPRDPYSNDMTARMKEEQAWSGNGWNANRVPSSVYTESNYAQTPQRTTMVEDTDSNAASKFPNPAQHQTNQQSSDMSWLNLGNGRGP